MIPLIAINDDFERTGCYFPLEMVNDEWVVYHGTSSTIEDAIDSCGIQWLPSIYTVEQLRAFARIFNSINWYGVHRGGYVVLASYSLSYDFQWGTDKPAYLAEIDSRAALYATKDFSGGETCRALRHAWKDLNDFVASDDIRTAHYKKQRDVCIRMLKDNQPPPRVIQVNVGWVKDQLRTLEPVAQRCIDIFDRHKYGVIYAVRFSKDDLDYISLEGHMGVASFKPIAPSHIIGKIRVSDSECEPSLTTNGLTANSKRHLNILKSSTSLVGCLVKKGGPPRKSTRQSVLSDPTLIDNLAGRNETDELVARYGSPELQAFIRTRPAVASPRSAPPPT